MNLLVFNLAVDKEHVTLAFGLKTIEALASRFDHVDVVTMYKGKYLLPPNVTVWSVGREHGYPKWLRVFRFYWIILGVLRARRIDVVFTHQNHIFGLLFWPIGRIIGISNLLWYAHSAVPLGLRLAHVAVDGVVSPSPESFRLSSNKVMFIGQGIDEKTFEFRSRVPKSVFHVVTVSRLSPVKGIELLIEALDGWRPNCRQGWKLTVIGGTTSPADERYAVGLYELARCISGGQVEFLGRLEPTNIASILSEADVFVNLSATGSLDKAIIEAMATGCITLSSNDAFRAIALRENLDSCIVERNSISVRNALDILIGMTPYQYEFLSRSQSQIARRDHTHERLINLLVDRLKSMA